MRSVGSAGWYFYCIVFSPESVVLPPPPWVRACLFFNSIPYYVNTYSTYSTYSKIPPKGLYSARIRSIPDVFHTYMYS
jgi:hypothetical protein